MSLPFDPNFFQNLKLKVKYIPTVKRLSPAEEAIRGFLEAPSESSIANLHSLHQLLLDAKHGKNKLATPAFFSDPNQIDTDQIYREYRGNQRAITKSIDLLIKSCKDPETPTTALAIEDVEILVNSLLKRNATLIQSTERFSAEKRKEQMSKMIKILPPPNDPKFENWSNAMRTFSNRMSRNAAYYKKLESLKPFSEQHRNKALEILKRVKQYKLRNAALPLDEPSKPSGKKLR